MNTTHIDTPTACIAAGMALIVLAAILAALAEWWILRAWIAGGAHRRKPPRN